MRPPNSTESSRRAPAETSYRVSQSRRQSLGFALAGIATMLRHQKNTRIMLLATLAVLAVGMWLGMDGLRWAVLTLVIAQVWIAEFINAAIEAAVDLQTQACHPLAKRAKDVAAGAVLLSSLAAAIIGLLLLGPGLHEKLAALLALP